MSPDRWKIIEAAFQTAIDLDPVEREAFLRAEFDSDEDLRHDVEKLIASSESADDFIESPVWTDSNFLNTSAKREISNSLDNHLPESDRDNFLGQQIGSYVLTREIGRGGMGAVYLAERADGEFFQRVAIKLIKRGMDSDFIVRRFRHERQILASFEHPFIARLLDGGTTMEGVPYFVMEYVEGESLYNFCDDMRLSIRDRLKLFQKVCSAIDYAHTRQIIHRDIKPSNILINRARAPKLLDFGIAKILDPNLIHESINPTASMLRMMTPDYASPEQVQGIEVTPSSDIYALGILLYELLTGHRPYNFAGRALHEVTHVICESMPELPSRVIGSDENLLPQYSGNKDQFIEFRATTAKQLRLDLAKELDDVIMKALSKEPRDRYSSVEDFSKDVSRYLSGASVEAPKFSARKRTKPDSFLRAPANSKALAVLPFKFLNLAAAEETDDGFLGLGLADALITRLSRVRRFVVRPTSSILSFGDELVDPVRAGKELNVDYILEGSIKKAKDRVRVTVQLLNVTENAAVWATSIDEVLSDVFTLEDTLANKVIEVLLPQLTGSELEEFANRGTNDPEAFEHYLRGRFYFNSFTEEGFAKAFVSFHSAIAADPNYAHAYAGIADYYNWLGILGVLPPQECYIPAMEAATKAVELDDNLSEAHTSLGLSLHAGKYEWSRAAHHLRKAIELNPSNASAYVWYSTVLYTMGRFDEGLEYAFRCVELDPLTPFYHHNIAWGLYFARRYDQATERYEKVIADFPNYGFGYYGLSKIHRITGDTKLAILENDKAMEMMGNSVFSLLSEAECYAADRQISAAKEKLSALHKLSEERYVSPYQLALVYSYLRDPEKVIEFLGKADETKEAWLNWMGIDPLFDFVCDDPRFDSILNRTGYRLFQKGFALDRPEANVTRSRPDNLHNLTTLVIDGELTDDGLSPARPRSRLIPSMVILLVALPILIAGFIGFQWVREDAAVSRPVVFQNASIVVLPFKSADAANETLGVGLADALTGSLGNIKDIQVISASTGRAIANDSPERIASAHDIAFVLRGNIANEDGGTTLFAELLNARDESTVWAEQFSAEDGDLFGLQARLAERIWTSLGIAPLPIEHQQVVKRYTRSNSAYQQYLVGRFQMTNRSAGNLRKAIETFSASLAEDPNFAPAYVGLADAYSLLNLYDIDPPADSYSRALQNVKKALAIDADLAEAHASHAYIKFFHERDRAGAELEFRRAVQLNPSYSQAHHWFALTLAAMNRRVEAVSEIETAKRLDPLSAAVRSAAGVVHFQSGFYKEAIEESNAALALDRGAVPAHKVKRWAFTSLNDPVSAMSAFESEIEFSGGNRSEPGWRIFELQIAALGDDRGEVVRKLDAISANPSIAKNAFAFAFEIAIAYNALGDSQSALNWLERSGAANAHSFNFLEVDPRLANLRAEPRFQSLVKTLTR